VFAAVMTGGSPGTVTAGKSAGVPIVIRSSIASQAVVGADVLSSAAGSQHAAFTLGTATDWYAGAAVFRPPSTGDTTAPTVPAGVTAGAAGGSVTVRWTAAADAVGVAGYTVYRNGAALGDAPPGQLSYSDTTIAPATSYDYTVAAYDAAGNRSAQSTAAHVDTPAAAPSYVQSGTVTTGARASAATLPLTKAVAAGDLLVGWFGQYDAAGQVQVSDNVNGAWTRVQGETFTSGNGDVGLYYVKSAAAAAGVTVKVAATVATYLQGTAADYGGATPPGPLVGSAVGSGNSSTADSGATPVAASGALVVTALMTGGSPGASVPQASTPGATPVVRSATASGSVAIADLLGAAPGPQHGAFALTASTDWYAMAAVFGP
jgi:hypothetical protein